MSELQDDIMIEVAGVIHDCFDSNLPPRNGEYGKNVHAHRLVADIKERIESLCSDAQDKMDMSGAEVDELEEERDCLASELADCEKDLEELENKAEVDKMIKQFWYYAERTTCADEVMI